MENHLAGDALAEPTDIHSGVVRKLLEAALLAARYGEAQAAATMVDAVEGIRPRSLKPPVARAMIALYADRPQEIVEIISKRILPEEPSNAVALSLLALAEYRLGNRSASHRLLNRVVSLNESPSTVTFAKTLLEE
jgi:hypothetical protein